MNWIAKAYDWTLERRWRTWVAHSVLGLALAFPFGAWTVMIFYGLREVEQVFGDLRIQLALDSTLPTKIDWEDHIADFVFPFFVLLLANIVLGW